jgi:hypothetical protein
MMLFSAAAQGVATCEIPKAIGLKENVFTAMLLLYVPGAHTQDSGLSSDALEIAGIDFEQPRRLFTQKTLE